MSLNRRFSLGLVLALAACDGPQSVLNPAGPQAKMIANLGWFVLLLLSAVALATMALIVIAALKERGTLESHAAPHTGGGKQWILWGGIVIPALILLVIFISGLSVMHAFPSPHHMAKEEIRVNGQQWWWELEYRFGETSQWVKSANEIHVPVGHTVQLELATKDVIHSFWVPRLHGKVDLIPGIRNAMRIRADKPGIYRGECAEFCGMQHAHMGIYIVAESPERFARWLAHQRMRAVASSDAEAERGRKVFMNSGCVVCHTIRGTPALGTVGPDLTHVASRQTIAAGTLPNTRGNLQAWIANAQSIKPGARMPNMTQFNGEELNALATYLQTLR